MELIVLALIAMRDLYKRQEPPSETEEFQPWDLPSLQYVYLATDRSDRRLGGRNKSHLAQAAS